MPGRGVWSAGDPREPQQEPATRSGVSTDITGAWDHATITRFAPAGALVVVYMRAFGVAFNRGGARADSRCIGCLV